MPQDPEGWQTLEMAQANRRSGDGSQPLVTIITPCRNAVGTIGDTLLSVLAAHRILRKDGWDLEHLLIDGGSTDGTAAVVANHVAMHGFCRWMADIIGGPYAAMNTGLRQARGCYSHVLNADDRLLDPRAYADFLQAGHRSSATVLLASIGYFRRPDPRLRSLWSVDPLPASSAEWKRQLLQGLHYPHPGFIAATDRYQQQSFDEAYSLAADYKLMQTVLLTQSPDDLPMTCQRPLVAMAEGGATGNWRAVLRGWRQLNAINQELGIQASSIGRYWRKLQQRFRHPYQQVNLPFLKAPDA